MGTRVLLVKLDGVLALRESWARPDEPILLCVGITPATVRYDAAGLDWWGKPARGALGTVAGGPGTAVFAAADAASGGAGPGDGGADAPAVVVWGRGPETLASRACRASARSWLVLTPHRLACVAAPAGPSVPEPEKKLFDRVAGFAKSPLSDPLFPPHDHVETVPITTVAEMSRERISRVALAERALPRGTRPRDVAVLRLSLVDGSGVDVVAAGGPEQARRLLSLVAG
ncbi:hypothetical protein GCM10022243_09360 [Saccharothrix violaceirubra]|uniref:Uncharacterized protein n=1 Tax=Saccharothrix violaceirubra TaxID=413306 RepID=A0A7W7WWL1_9PSEU|nr:hypothetical protein [Saccharothrix violaceirubra]MBB4966226.1 hypothetical protein [Saccharothrix violaceirubra]